MLYVAMAIVVSLVILHWRIRYVNAHGKITMPSISLVILSVIMFTLIGFVANVNRWDTISRSGNVPVAMAVVFDTSLSMYSGPDPTRYPRIKTRFDRSKEVVMEIIHRLDEQRRNMLVSIIVFTVRAANALGWNPNLQEVEQIINGSLTTNLIGRGGTDLGGALARTLEVFDSLPDRIQSSSEKVVLLVSDGERTVNMVDLEEVLQAFRQRGIRVIALHVGLLDEPEGIREYDEFGFIGFWKGMGETYTIPDTNSMVEIAGRDDSQGLYVRVEDPQAANRILRYLQGEGRILTQSLSIQQIFALCFWLLTSLMLTRLLA
jgi:hypothetical protein